MSLPCFAVERLGLNAKKISNELGEHSQRLSQSTLNTMNSGVLYPPICAAHVLADRPRHRLPSKPHLATQSRRRRRKTSDRQRRAKSSANNEVGTIDDKTGNYRRAVGTISDSKKPHQTQRKTPRETCCRSFQHRALGLTRAATIGALLAWRNGFSWQWMPCHDFLRIEVILKRSLANA